MGTSTADWVAMLGIMWMRPGVDDNADGERIMTHFCMNEQASRAIVMQVRPAVSSNGHSGRNVRSASVTQDMADSLFLPLHALRAAAMSAISKKRKVSPLPPAGTRPPPFPSERSPLTPPQTDPTSASASKAPPTNSARASSRIRPTRNRTPRGARPTSSRSSPMYGIRILRLPGKGFCRRIRRDIIRNGP